MRSRTLSRLLLGSFCLVLPALGCSTVKETGRRQLMLVTSGQEQALGVQAYREILSKAKRSTDVRMTAIVERVGRRISEVADRPDFQWEFALIESPQVNAFCLPGGKIAVYTGILPIMKNEAGMAVVIGHEVAHAVARHGGERMSQQMSVEIIQELLAKGLAKASPTVQSAALQAFGVGAQVGALLPYSRAHESEADQIGLIYAAKAGYDPREAVGLWQRMAEVQKSKPPEFLSTHPREKRRIGQFEKEMPAALEAYRAASQQHGLGESW